MQHNTIRIDDAITRLKSVLGALAALVMVTGLINFLIFIAGISDLAWVTAAQQWQQWFYSDILLQYLSPRAAWAIILLPVYIVPLSWCMVVLFKKIRQSFYPNDSFHENIVREIASKYTYKYSNGDNIQETAYAVKVSHPFKPRRVKVNVSDRDYPQLNEGDFIKWRTRPDVKSIYLLEFPENAR